MASITQRTWTIRGKVKQGFQARVRRKGFPEFSKLFKTRSDAVKWSRELEAKLLLGADVPRKDDTTVGALVQRYLTEVTPLKRGKEPERCRLAKMCRDPIARYAIAKLSPLEVAAYRERRMASASADTVVKELNLLSAVFETARKEWCHPSANPVRSVRKPKPSSPRRPFSPSPGVITIPVRFISTGRERAPPKQVTCRSAFARSGCSFNSAMAGRISNLIPWRLASRFTSFMTGKLPPVTRVSESQVRHDENDGKLEQPLDSSESGVLHAESHDSVYVGRGRDELLEDTDFAQPIGEGDARHDRDA